MVPIACADADTPAAQLSQVEAEEAVLCLINEQRAAAGVAPLSPNNRLRIAARRQAQAAVLIKWWAGGGPQIHTNPVTGSTPQSRIAETGYCFGHDVATNENGYDAYYTGPPHPNTSPRGAVDWWMSSPGHRTTLLDPAYTESGVAVLSGVVEQGTGAEDADGAYVFVQTFGGCSDPEPARETDTWTWGFNTSGELGDGTSTSRPTPGMLKQLHGVISVAAGSHSLALLDDGTLFAWGPNGYGQVGDGSTTQRHEPVKIDIDRVVGIGAGYAHSLALTDDGTVRAWGQSDDGKLGTGTTEDHLEPVEVARLAGVVAVSAGFAHSLALRTDGSVWAWGANSSGQLGNGTEDASPLPIRVAFPGEVDRITAISAGGVHSTALDDTGRLWTWGGNGYGQLGDGTTDLRTTPIEVELDGRITAVAGCFGHTLALVGGQAWAWGDNQWGQLGDGSTTQGLTPLKVQRLTDVVAIAGGPTAFHSLASTRDRSVWGWGNNFAGSLGDGTTTERHRPVRAGTLHGVVALAGGHYHTLAAL